MNKKIETQKIKVNNGQELIQKAKEYKNSGGEWKLLERHFTLPTRGEVKGWSLENNSEGFIISNGEQKLDIYLEGNRKVVDLLTDNWDQIEAIFPEVFQTCGSDDLPFKMPCKEINEGEKKVIFGRFLVAWSVDDIFKIICDYCRENRAEIKKSIASLDYETSLKKWIKVGNDNKGNIFIWLGKREEENINLNGGGELQISVNRKDLENYSSARQEWGGFVSWKDLDNSQLSQELLERIESFWHLISKFREKGAISSFDNHQVGFTTIPDFNSDLPNKETYSPNTGGSEKTSNNKNIQLKDSEKKEIVSYFIAKNISKISLENDKLIIEYKDHTKKVIENEDQELQKYHQIIQTLPNQSISFSDLQNNTNNLSTPNQNNPAIYVSLALGAFVLGGVLVYCLTRKKKK